jgi:hypothetical protein
MNHLNTVSCCGHTFTAQDIKPPLMTAEKAFGTRERMYGGRAKWFANANCPECGKEYVLWLEPKAPNYRVLTISERESEEKPRRGRRPQPVEV